MSKNSNWKSLESHVRDIASIIWRVSAKAERIDGVNFDAVLYPSEDEVILVEITEQNNLDKIRSDIAKIEFVKLGFLKKSILAKAYIVMSKEPTAGMIDAGKSARVSVLSARQFDQLAIDYSAYSLLRDKLPFGSSIDPNTGKTDQHSYIGVNYSDRAQKNLTLDDVAKKLIKNEKLVLLGDYGTGKSRCIRELFYKLSNDINLASGFTLAINLREHWGARSAVEIIAGHLTNIGLSTSIDRAIQLLHAGHLILLLDGFDEVGAQTFGVTQEKRASVRRDALKGIKELITTSHAGLLVTGRPHYFNSDAELVECLGVNLSSASNSIIRCPDEFDDSQANSYLRSLNIKSSLPEWFPRKPLMFQILSVIDESDVEKILSSNDGAIDFWGQFIETICQREAKIHTSFDASSVRMILQNLARHIRVGDRSLGRITPKVVVQAYEEATGYAPDESGQLMLSRMCTLGRIEPESPDRQFVDPYIVQLLFAECLIEDISEKRFEVLETVWRQAINRMGLTLLAQWVDVNDLYSQVLFLLRKLAQPKNSQLIGELICALAMMDYPNLDLTGTVVDGADLPILDLSKKDCLNVIFKDCFIHVVDLNETKITPKSNFQLIDSIIGSVIGVSSTVNIPKWMSSCKVESTESLSTSSRIKASNLPPAQKLFLSVIHKIFFQSGGGRKESSLYKGGFGQEYDRHLIDSILKVLVNDGYVHKSKDNAGFIYNPRREYTPKMKAIKDELTLSKDSLWMKIGELKK